MCVKLHSKNLFSMGHDEIVSNKKGRATKYSLQLCSTASCIMMGNSIACGGRTRKNTFTLKLSLYGSDNLDWSTPFRW